jgi:hypothetical protein
MSDTTAIPWSAWPLVDVQLCSVRRTFVEFIPPAQSTRQSRGPPRSGEERKKRGIVYRWRRL